MLHLIDGGARDPCSIETTLKELNGVGPGCVDIIPRNRVTLHVRTWLYSEQTE